MGNVLLPHLARRCSTMCRGPRAQLFHVHSVPLAAAGTARQRAGVGVAVAFQARHAEPLGRGAFDGTPSRADVQRLGHACMGALGGCWAELSRCVCLKGVREPREGRGRAGGGAQEEGRGWRGGGRKGGREQGGQEGGQGGEGRGGRLHTTTKLLEG